MWCLRAQFKRYGVEKYLKKNFFCLNRKLSLINGALVQIICVKTSFNT